jgi:hypothetical protein
MPYRGLGAPRERLSLTFVHPIRANGSPAFGFLPARIRRYRFALSPLFLPDRVSSASRQHQERSSLLRAALMLIISPLVSVQYAKTHRGWKTGGMFAPGYFAGFTSACEIL